MPIKIIALKEIFEKKNNKKKKTLPFIASESWLPR